MSPPRSAPGSASSSSPNLINRPQAPFHNISPLRWALLASIVSLFRERDGAGIDSIHLQRDLGRVRDGLAKRIVKKPGVACGGMSSDPPTSTGTQASAAGGAGGLGCKRPVTETSGLGGRRQLSGFGPQLLVRDTTTKPVWPTIWCRGRTERPYTFHSRWRVSNISVSQNPPPDFISSTSFCTCGTVGR